MADQYRNVLRGQVLRLKTGGPADLILKVGRIWTGDPEHPWAEALAARGGAIVAAGPVDEVMRHRGPGTRVLDRPDAFALPGLIDAHAHMTALGAIHDEINLRGVNSPEEVARRVREKIAAKPGDGWILGQNWDQSLWPGGQFPTAAMLDRAAPHRPVWLTRVDGHAGWANSEALQRAGVTAETRAPHDGQILRDAQGRPTGVFIDGATGLVTRAIPAPSKQDVRYHLLFAQRLALEAGLTGVHDASVLPQEAVVYRDLDGAGELKLRVYGMAYAPHHGAIAFVTGAKPAPYREGRRFELQAIKLFIDGAMGSRGGLLFESYSDDPGNVGLELIDPKVLEETTVSALRNGWQVCTHAIGDKGNALVLDAYAAALRAVPEATDPRLRIEHAQIVRRADVSRFRALGVIASMQPGHAGTDQRWADARLGPERVNGAYAWSWFRDAGVRLAFGSDFPVEIVRPYWGFYAALTRQNPEGQPPGGWHPEHRITLEETLRAYTAGSAYAAFAEDRLGVLRRGLRADVTVLDRDPFRAEPRAILDARVVATVVDGEIVHEAGR